MCHHTAEIPRVAAHVTHPPALLGRRRRAVSIDDQSLALAVSVNPRPRGLRAPQMEAPRPIQGFVDNPFVRADVHDDAA